MKWFQHDCDTTSDPKIKLLRKKHGIAGVGTYFEINRLIAKNVEKHNLDEWGYLPSEYSDDYELLAEEIGTETVQSLYEIISYCVEKGLLYKIKNRIVNPKVLTRADRYTKDICAQNKVDITEYVQKLYSHCTEYVPTIQYNTIQYKQDNTNKTIHDNTIQNNESKKKFNPQTSSSDSLPKGKNPNIAGIERMRESLKGKVLLNVLILVSLLLVPLTKTEAKTYSLNYLFTTDSKYKLATATASLRLRDKTPEKSRRVPAPDVAAVSVRQLICRKFRNNCEMAVAIARAESGLNCGRRSYMANTNGTYDHGLFQINDVHKSRLTKLGMTMQDMYDCEKNIEYAHDWLYAYQGWNPWVSYTNGSYLAHYKNANYEDQK